MATSKSNQLLDFVPRVVYDDTTRSLRNNLSLQLYFLESACLQGALNINLENSQFNIYLINCKIINVDISVD